mmetsp:Transcript_65832/g.157320  ORF Transcript_65832/g.157320 Transcript_65832/m.157320 type:complete len:517 (+) Transcript_65832:169-1719(+)
MSGGGEPPWEELQRVIAALAEAGGDENEEPATGGSEQGPGVRVAGGPPPGFPPFQGFIGFPGAPGFIGVPRNAGLLPGPGVMVWAHLTDEGPRLRVAMEGPSSDEDIIHAMGHAIRAILEQRMQQQVQEERQLHPPACELVRDALPRVVVTKEDLLDSTNSKCSVCLEDYQAGSHATRMLCGHLFCTTCIRDWLRTANSCPVCRYELRTDNQEYEVGRQERMRERKVRLKEGELRAMRIPDLRRLMRALDISGDGCVEKAELIGRFGASPGVELSPDKEDLLYEESELHALALPLLRALCERHGMHLNHLDELSEQEERDEMLHRFAVEGWMGLKPKAKALAAAAAPKAPEKDKEQHEEQPQKPVAPSRPSSSSGKEGASASKATATAPSESSRKRADERKSTKDGTSKRSSSKAAITHPKVPDALRRGDAAASSGSGTRSSSSATGRSPLISRHTLGHLPSATGSATGTTPTAATSSHSRVSHLPSTGGTMPRRANTLNRLSTPEGAGNRPTQRQ